MRKSGTNPLPLLAAKAFAAGRRLDPAVHVFPDALSHCAADLAGDVLRCFFEAHDDRLARCGFALRKLRPVVKESSFATPHQRALGGVATVAELELGNIPRLGLPNEKIEVIVVEPAPPQAQLRGHALN